MKNEECRNISCCIIPVMPMYSLIVMSYRNFINALFRNLKHPVSKANNWSIKKR